MAATQQKLRLVPRGWSSFQHYKGRTPPWVKLHRTLLDDREFQRLPTASRALAPMLWLLASESTDGVFDATEDELAFRLRQDVKEILAGLQPLIDAGFFQEVPPASTVIAERKQPASAAPAGRQQLATPETEGEAEAEAEKSPPASPDLFQSSNAAADSKSSSNVLPGGFIEFWQEWPSSERKAAKSKCSEVWRKRGLEVMAQTIIQHVKAMKRSSSWAEQGGKFIPAPLSYLNGEKWDGAEVGQATATSIMAGVI